MPLPYNTGSSGTRNASMTDIDPNLPPAAQRALAEAAERRKKAKEAERPVELGGRDGPDPVRFGDWEKKGIAIDF
jgi:hypothetical protein